MMIVTGADAALERLGRRRSFGAPPLQRTPAPLRICSDRDRPRFSPDHRRDVRLGQPALCSGGCERVARRQKESGASRSRAGGSEERTTAQRARLSACRRPCGRQAHTPPLRDHRSKRTIPRRAVAGTAARQKAQGIMITARTRQAVVAAPIVACCILRDRSSSNGFSNPRRRRAPASKLKLRWYY